MRPKGLLFDYGGTLVEEVSYDMRAGHEWLLAHAAHRPPSVALEQVLERANRVANEVAGRRDQFQIETPWSTTIRLIYDYLGLGFEIPLADLELGYWKASVKTRPMPGAREALDQLLRAGVPAAVVSNSSFGEPVIRFELGRHGLADGLTFIMVSADYSVRKPNPLFFDTAAARLGWQPQDVWFVGDRLDTDVAGAKSAGMPAVWFNPLGAEDPLSSADFTVSDWDAMVRLVFGE